MLAILLFIAFLSCGLHFSVSSLFTSQDLLRIQCLNRRSIVNVLPDGRKIFEVSHDPNQSTSESGGSSPDSTMRIDDGSLTLAQFVEQIEAETDQVVQMMDARFRLRRYLMPVTAPQPNMDRFAGQGDELVEDVVYDLAGRQRLSIHEIIEFYTETSKEEKCLAKNMEYLNAICTYPGKKHPCFEGTIVYQKRPIHLVNIEGVAAHLCAHGTRTEVAATYCCFTEKCLTLCYQDIDYDLVFAKKNGIIK